MLRLLITNSTNVTCKLWPKTGGRIQNSRYLASRGCEGSPAKSMLHSYRKIKTDYADKSTSNVSRILTTSEAFNGTNIELDDLELNLEDGTKLSFNLTWLRDSCHCDSCTHQFSRQRLFTPKDFDKQLFVVKEVKIHQNYDIQQHKPSRTCWPTIAAPQTNVSGSYLEITWADGHESLYPINWLTRINSLYTASNLDFSTKPENYNKSFELPQDDFYLPRESEAVNPVYWNVNKIIESLAPVDYHDLTDGFNFEKFNSPTFINANKISDLSARRFNAMFSLSHQLVTYGLAKIVNVPQEPSQVLNIARSLAYERPTGYGTIFNVVIEPSEEINLAYSAREFDLHSDLPYRETGPGVQLLHCITNSSIGGMSYFSDAFNAAKQLLEFDRRLFKILVEFPVTFVVRDPYRNTKFRRQRPILSLDFKANLSEVYYSAFVLPPVGHRDDIKLFYLAQDKFTQLLHSKDNKLIVKMEPGDLFIFHNRRVLHGRSSYDPASSNRFLQGCYMDWDEIECLYEKLHASNRWR